MAGDGTVGDVRSGDEIRSVDDARLIGAVRRKLLVVGIDGLRWDRVEASGARRLLELRRAGVFAPSLLPIGYGAESVSGPGWSTVATGAWPSKHGVRDNAFNGKRFDRYPDFLTRMTRAGLSTVAIVDWPPLAAEGVFSREVGVLLDGDGEERGYLSEDRRLTDATVRLLGNDDPDAIFLYLGSVDVMGHACGAASTEYLEMIRAVDDCLASVLDAIAARPSRTAEDWLVVITTDHGHLDAGGHGGTGEPERRVFILFHGDGIGPAEVDDTSLVDLAATALEHVGLPMPAELDGTALGGMLRNPSQPRRERATNTGRGTVTS
jgi:predicted AlkP superfamily pyrophosphatase or phosphodiesterase